jgi:hypothetical protein
LTINRVQAGRTDLEPGEVGFAGGEATVAQGQAFGQEPEEENPEHEEEEEADGDDEVLPISLSPSIVDIAVEFFANEYLPMTHYAYLTRAIKDYGPTSKALMSASKAAALANFARERHDGQLMRFSRKAYLVAIRDVNFSLRSPTECTENGTLIAAMTMGLYEAITFDDKISLESWIAHSNGTLSLIKFRGDELLDTMFGKQIFCQVSNHIRANCAQTAAMLPKDLVDLDVKMAPVLTEAIHPVVPHWPMVNNRLQYMIRHPQKYTPTQIMIFAVEQDEQQLRIMINAERFFAAHGLGFWKPPAESFKAYAHSHSGIAMIRYMNTIFVMRLVRFEILHELASIVRTSRRERSKAATDAWLDFERAARQVVQDTADKILSTLHFYLLTDPKNDPDGLSPIQTCEVQGFVWPLACFARYHLVTEEQRQHAKHALKHIGQRAKLPIAKIISENFNPDSIRYEQLHMLHLI